MLPLTAVKLLSARMMTTLSAPHSPPARGDQLSIPSP